MSVIKNLVAMPNRVKNIYQRLMQVGERGEARETLLAYLNPPSLQRKRAEEDEDSDSTPMGQDVLRESTLLGIVEEYVQQEQDTIRLKLAVPLRKGEITLRAYLEEALLVPERASILGQTNFPTVMAWFLMQDSSQPLNFTAMPAQSIRDLFHGERFELTTNARTQEFYYWARYLGFGWLLENKTVPRGVYADPSIFLERHLPALLTNRGEVLLRDIMANLARRYPVFEGSAIREELEDLIPSQHRRLPHELAASTSFALSRLERKGVIRMEDVADAPKMSLLTWPQSRSVSHIALVSKESR